jgi:hypothetical protein
MQIEDYNFGQGRNSDQKTSARTPAGADPAAGIIFGL